MTQYKARLLVVTQDSDLKRLIESLMQHERIQAAVTGSVAHAAHFLRGNALPDVIVLDLATPGEPTLEFIQQLRGLGEFARLPVLVLTAVPDPVQVRAALQAGANRYLTKLFAAKNLLSTVEEMLLAAKPARLATGSLGGNG